MTTLSAIDPGQASDEARRVLERVLEKLGLIPRLMRVMVNSPCVLEGYLAMLECLEGGRLDQHLRLSIALTVSQANESAYCVSIFTALAKAAGFSNQAIRDAREGQSPDSRVDAALRFARALLEERARVSDRHVRRLRRFGLTDAEIAEIVAQVGVVGFANHFSHVARPVPDFPAVPLDEVGREGA